MERDEAEEPAEDAQQGREREEEEDLQASDSEEEEEAATGPLPLVAPAGLVAALRRRQAALLGRQRACACARV